MTFGADLALGVRGVTLSIRLGVSLAFDHNNFVEVEVEVLDRHCSVGVMR